MNSLELITSSLTGAKNFAEGLLRDMADEPLTRATPKVGAHPYWLLGHIVVAEGAVLDQYLLGRASRYASWTPLFGIGTSPADTIEGGPSYSELLDAFDAVRADLLAHIETLSESDLDKPCHENDWGGPRFGSVGECLSALAQHTMFHAGQAACCRRAAGRGPLYL